MALLGFDGFEHKTAAGPWARGGLTYAGASTPTYVAGRFGGSALRTGTPVTITGPFGSYTGLYIGCAFMVDTARVSTSAYFNFYGPEGNLRYIYVSGSAAGTVTLNRDTNDAVLASAVAGSLIPGAWNYLEAYCGPLHATTGRVIVKANGVTVIDYTGNTLGSATTNDLPGNIVAVGTSTAPSASGAIDDLYICSDTGPAPYNTFLGDVKVESLIPNNNGTFSQLVGSDGNSVDNYLLVDEQPASATDYVGSAVVGQRDTYPHTDLTTPTANVLALQVIASALKSDAGVGNMKTISRLAAGTERLSSAVALPASVGPVSGGIETTDPAGAAWTVASVNAAQFGVEVA